MSSSGDSPWDGDAPLAAPLDKPVERPAESRGRSRGPIDVIEGAESRLPLLLGLELPRLGTPPPIPDAPVLRVGDLRQGTYRAELIQRGLRETRPADPGVLSTRPLGGLVERPPAEITVLAPSLPTDRAPHLGPTLKVEGTEPEVEAYVEPEPAIDGEAITGDLVPTAAPQKTEEPQHEFGPPPGEALLRALNASRGPRVARPRSGTEARIHAQNLAAGSGRAARDWPVLRGLVTELRFAPATPSPEELRAWIELSRAIEGLQPGDARHEFGARGDYRGEPRTEPVRAPRRATVGADTARQRADELTRDMADSLLVGQDASGDSEMRLTLGEEFFGGTELRVVRSLDGIVAVFLPPDRDTYRLLSSEGPRLRAELEGKGIRVSRVEVLEPE